ncbi:Arc family DNA-binding protein [Marinovum sp. PR37]|nr:Arc family DNA-binding protein [Marinovum sp. PR37]
MQLRLPPDLKRWIEEQAEANGSSQNSEVIRAVRERMAKTNQVQSS